MDAERIDRSLGVVVCSHCGGLHELEPAQAPADSATAPRAPDGHGHAHTQSSRLDRGTVPLPERFEVTRGDRSLQVSWTRGSKKGAIVLALFALVWAGATFFVGVLFLAPVSLFLLYFAAVRGLNRTELRVSAGQLELRSGPLPWRNNHRKLTPADVRQLFAREIVTRSTTGSDGNRQIQEFRSYAVVAIDPQGHRRTLIGGFSLPAHALWFEREIEQLFGIDDAAVDAEVRY